MTPARATALLWLGALVGGVVIAVATKIGPVEVVLPGRSHGLHAGDLVGFAAMAVLATVGTVWVRR